MESFKSSGQTIDLSFVSFNSTEEDINDFDVKDLIEEYMSRERLFGQLTEYLLIGFYGFFMGSGILSNSAIISVIVFNKKLRTSNNILLINLFISDLLLCVFCMPFTLLALIRRSWQFGQFMCKLIPFIQAISIFVSAATITSIAIDRMSQITSNRIKGKTRVRREYVKYSLNAFVIWFISLVLASPICVYQDVVQQGIQGFFTYDKCLEDWPKIYKSIYSFIILFVQLLIPNSVMLFSHYRIRKHLNVSRFVRGKPSRDSNQNKSPIPVDCQDCDELSVDDVPTTSSGTANNSCSTPMTQTYNYRHYRKEVRRNNRITLFLITITILFGISWLPWNAFNVLVDFMADIDMSTKNLYLILAICHLVAMSSATTNAIFYGFLHTNIRIEMTNGLRKLRKIIF